MTKMNKNNKNDILEKAKINYKENISDDKKEENNEKNRKRYHLKKDYINRRRHEIHINRIKNDIVYKISYNIKLSIRKSLKENGYQKIKRTEEILGLSIKEFKIYLESKFETWMSWDNRGLYNGELNYGWDIDHIIPVSSAKNEDDIIRLNHYTNLQPLCSKLNRDVKRDRLDFYI